MQIPSRKSRIGTPAGPRNFLLWVRIHKYVGLTALAFLLVAALTGVPLVFEHSLDVALNHDLFDVSSSAAGFDAADLAARLEAVDPRLQVVSVPMHTPPDEVVVLTVAPRTLEGGSSKLDFDQVFVNPLDGTVRGTRLDTPGLGRRHFTRSLYALHANLLAGTWGGRVMGSVGLLWLLESLVGLYLTLPRRGPFFAQWKSVWVVRWHGQWTRFLLDLHRASGLWMAVPLLVFASSSFAIGLYYEAFEPLVKAFSKPAPTEFDHPADPGAAHRPSLGWTRARDLGTEQARARGLAWPAAAMSYVPERALYGVMFTSTGRVEYRGLGPVTYYLRDPTGALAFMDDPYHGHTGEKFLRSVYPIHTGEFGGPVTRWAVLLLGVLSLEMSVSGLLIWWRKRRRRLEVQRLTALPPARA